MCQKLLKDLRIQQQRTKQANDPVLVEFTFSQGKTHRRLDFQSLHIQNSSFWPNTYCYHVTRSEQVLLMLCEQNTCSFWAQTFHFQCKKPLFSCLPCLKESVWRWMSHSWSGFQSHLLEDRFPRESSLLSLHFARERNFTMFDH